MKGLTKTIVALALVVAVLATMGMSAMAAQVGAYSTKTIYQADNKVSVEANASGLEEGDIVTYVATTDETDVNEKTIVYINQAEADGDGKAQFTYTTDVTNINASMFFGGSREESRVGAEHAEDLAIKVVVGSESVGTFYAAKQAKDDLVVIRKFDFSGIADFSAAEITKVEFDGTEIQNFCVDATTLMVSTNIINKAGTLTITTTDATDFVAPKISGTTKLENDTLIAVAKAPVGEKFGIVLYKDNADVVIDGGVKTAADYVVLPALGKNVAGIYAVELQGVKEYLAAPFNVKAYAYDGSTYVLSDAAVVIE